MSVELPVSGKPLKKRGPAYTLFLRWTGGDFYKGLLITVDLTLAVRINSRSSKLNLEFSSPSGQVLKSLLDSVPHYFAIGSYRNVLIENQPNFFEENANVLDRKCKNLCLRCSHSCLEQAIFCYFGLDGGQTKCLRLLKLLREEQGNMQQNLKIGVLWLKVLEKWFHLMSLKHWCYMSGRKIQKTVHGLKIT